MTQQVNGQQVLDVLQKRAQTDRLIEEILRSCMLEAANVALAEANMEPIGHIDTAEVGDDDDG